MYGKGNVAARVSKASKNSLAPGLVTIEYLEALRDALLEWTNATNAAIDEMLSTDLRLGREGDYYS